MSDTAESDRLQRKFENLEGQLKLIENALRDLRAEISNTAGAAWDAVAAAGVAQPEPEYEYSWEGVDDEGDGWIMDEWFATVAGAERYADSRMGNWVRTDKGKLIRRVKAGAWEPAPNQEGQP